MNVLVACEESQRVCKAFREKGHEAYSCDIQECSGGHPEWHIRGDVLKVLNPKEINFTLPLDEYNNYVYGIEFRTADGKHHFVNGKWDLIIAHPPCTYMSKAGARFMYLTAGNVNQERLEKALQAKEFFVQFMNADCDKICIENPTPLKIVGLPKESQVIQPYQFGHPYSKRTLLWLKGLPELKPTNILTEYTPYLPSNTGGFARGKGGSRGVAHNAKDASKTFSGIAQAMAEQWG
jgi:hypothetical protein